MQVGDVELQNDRQIGKNSLRLGGGTKRSERERKGPKGAISGKHTGAGSTRPAWQNVGDKKVWGKKMGHCTSAEAWKETQEVGEFQGVKGYGRSHAPVLELFPAVCILGGVMSKAEERRGESAKK